MALHDRCQSIIVIRLDTEGFEELEFPRLGAAHFVIEVRLRYRSSERYPLRHWCEERPASDHISKSDDAPSLPALLHEASNGGAHATMDHASLRTLLLPQCFQRHARGAGAKSKSPLTF